ncbi:MAG: hypothetical protein Athens101428_765, partial [Candidatus Berkelbacteria bacterium Athens1014_28]
IRNNWMLIKISFTQRQLNVSDATGYVLFPLAGKFERFAEEVAKMADITESNMVGEIKYWIDEEKDIFETFLVELIGDGNPTIEISRNRKNFVPKTYFRSFAPTSGRQPAYA